MSQLFATKGNLILAKRSLALSKTGYELLDKKRNILIREMMQYIDRAKELQQDIDTIFKTAYQALQDANMTLGVIENISKSVYVDDSVEIFSRSVMGAELPIVSINPKEEAIPYGMIQTNSMLDKAYISFLKVKKLSAQLAEVENCVYRLAYNIKSTQKRANALKNIVIPRYEKMVKSITESLEEKEREEFTRLKVIKKRKKAE